MKISRSSDAPAWSAMNAASAQARSRNCVGAISLHRPADNDVAHGMMKWIGGITLGSLQKTGPADPRHMAVTSILFDSNTAAVCGIIDYSVFPEDIELPICLNFTDSRATGAPIEAGNIIVR
jgi:hypothetical protein